MGRPCALNTKTEAQLVVMLDCGITQISAARALGVSRRTVGRFVAREREKPEPTLEELLVPKQTLAEVLAGVNDREPARPVRRGSQRGWRAAARALAEQHPERWADPVDVQR